jgi:hypothetical protein|tara:strand:- start:735 stop:1385 length:651 start_codon:yes stop_codon:yes gene_type:complete
MKRTSVLLLTINCFFLIGCGNTVNTSSLEREVLQSVKETTAIEYDGVTPLSVSLKRMGSNLFTGILVNDEDGRKVQYDIKVNTNGNLFEWELSSDGEDINHEHNIVNSFVTSPCDMNSSELDEFLTKNSFSVNGNGRVVFDRNNNVYINGGRADLRGTYSTSSGNVRISNLQAVSGYFDPSNNNGSSGRFSVDCNGNMNGNLYSGGQSRSVLIIKE